MKGLIVSFALLISSSAFAADPAAEMVRTTLEKGRQILAIKSPEARNIQMCALIKDGLDHATIAPQLLGPYAQLSTDQAGIDLFLMEIVSLTTTKLIGMVGDGKGGTIDVDGSSVDRGDGTFTVGVHVQTANGNAYDGTAILANVGGKLLLRDAEYLGFSAVRYIGNDIQKKIDDEAETDADHPITAFMNKQMADANFINCH